MVFGSFVFEKPVPNDVDIFMLFDDDLDAYAYDHEATVLLDHAAANAYFWGECVLASAANSPQLSSTRQSEMAADEELLK